MPMDFPDMQSLRSHAEIWKFRLPRDDEPEAEYRAAFADFVEPHDFVEAQEIRNKVGWDKFSEAQSREMVFRSIRRSRKA